jgi:hypothetical protein
MRLGDLGKNVVARTARNQIAWSMYKLCGGLSHSLGRIYGHAHFTRQIGERDETLRKLAQDIFPERTVAAGPFRGMQYTSAQACGSTLLPKLLGSYESELHPVLEEMLANEYTAIVDIGCAEGYYAVGLGLKLANAEVYAFDVDFEARKLCGDLAKLNGLDGRVHIGGFCDEATLRSIPLGSKALIISDCEGYEGVFFTSDIVKLLARHDIIIETHDFIDIDISSRLRDVFVKTHLVRSIKSTDDIEKAHTYRYAQTE